VTLFEPDDRAPAPSGETVRVSMLVAYDGRDFHGFAANAGVKTVAGVLTEALERVLGHGVDLTCAGRTDRGVHARGQVISFDAARNGLDLDRLQRSVNGLCKPWIVVRDASLVANSFSARFSATGRRYRYTIVNRPVPDPFLHAQSWHVAKPLDFDLLRLACDPFIGEHDFSAFCRKVKVKDAETAPSLVRRVRNARWVDDGDGLLRFWIEANAFCHQMVRSIVGTMVAVGHGRITPGEIHGILASQDRRRAGEIAPPDGLVLWDVMY
jgi:tRNA pseudouridine38-40 synthase